jgi:hypothetical protein
MYSDISKLERIREKVAMVYFKPQFNHSLEVTRKPQKSSVWVVHVMVKIQT